MSPDSTFRISDAHAVRFDQGRHYRAKLGFILLATEQTVADDVIALAPAGVGVHFARVAIPDSITRATLSAQSDLLAPAAATLLPDGSIDVISYACTSGSLVIGEGRVAQEINRGAPHAKASSIIAAVKRALRAVGARRIAVATPYLDELNRDEAAYLQRDGFDVVNIQGLNLEKDSDMARVAPDFLMDFAAAVDRPDADALFVSCGALRTLDVVAALEQRVGKPVICSNQAMTWDALRLAGIDDRIDGYGRLLSDF